MSWTRMLAALDEAVAALRTRGATATHLERAARSSGFLGARARSLAAAMRALDARLAATGMRDGRLAGTMLAEAIAATPRDELEALLGARSLRSRWLLAWEPADLAWWRALDDKLAPGGGGARVVLPGFDRPLEGTRERDPLDALAEEVARGLDGPPESEIVAPVLGDLSGTAALSVGPHVRLVRANDVVAQAAAAARIVGEALDRGAAVERVAVVLPSLDERTLAPLRRAFEAEGIIAHEGNGAPPSSTPVVAAALLALEAAESLERRQVARLLRSGWLDAARLVAPSPGAPGPEAGRSGAGVDRRAAERALARVAGVLETSATASGSGPAERLVKTVAAGARAAAARSRRTEADLAADDETVRRVVAALVRAREASTRVGRARAARALWTELGIGARAGRGGLAAFSTDSTPTGVPRAERIAIARDARAWDVLSAAVDLYESVAQRVRAAEQLVDADAFRLELVELVDAGASQPGAARVGAVRVLRLHDAPGDELELAVVLDAALGVLPRDDAEDALVSDALAEAIVRASRGAYVSPAQGARRARDLAALAVTAADAKEIALVFPREDASGAPLAPSPIVDALERGGVAIEAASDASATASEGRRTRAAANASSDAPARADVARRLARERSREGFFLDPARPRSDVVGDLAPSPAAAALLVRETGGAERALAVTSLERFAKCAFQGYAHVVLAAREADRRDELPDAREEGTLGHEALATAFVATQDLWPRRPRDRAAILARGLAAAEAVLEEWQAHAPLRTVVRLRIADSVRAVLGAAVDDDAWDFALAEQPFGAREPSWPALALEDGDLRLVLRGTIDRVDRAHDGKAARVLDYKRSKSTVRSAAKDLGATVLQVPLYACVVARQLGVPATGGYAPMQARDVGADGKRGAAIEEQTSDLVRRPKDDHLTVIERRALDVVASARAGMLAPVPADERQCQLCAVSGGCRKPRFAMEPLEDGVED